MIKQVLGAVGVVLLVAPYAISQTAATQNTGNWRSANKTGAAPAAGAQVKATVAPTTATLQAHRVRSLSTPAVPIRGSGKDMLPNNQGQVWRQYDISGYTSVVKGVETPEQAIIDWILRETGTDVWFTEPLGLLSANKKTLTVYHTPEMQRIVAETVGRFVNGSKESHVLGLRVVAVNSPNWRSRVMRLLRPIAVQAPGIDAWLLSRENAAMLMAELRRRSDFREHSAHNLVFYNGQPQTISQLRPRNYVRSYRARDNAWAGFEPVSAQLQEGSTLQLSPLLSQDEQTIDVVLKCKIDQIEKLVSVSIDLPGFNGQVQRAQVQVPQMVSWRLHERFRWPADQVLLLSCGVVASPGPERPSALGFLSPMLGTSGRADALVLIDYRGKASQALVTGQSTTAGAPTTGRGARY